MYFNGIQFILLIVIVLTLNLCESHYTIIAPGTIKSNRKFSVCVTLHDISGPATIRVGIQSSSSLNISQLVTLQSYESRLLEFIPPKLINSFTYQLVTEGISGIIFQNSSKLNVLDEGGPIVYVEPDKGVYAPNDLVQFRVVILDEHMIPMKIVEPIKVEILDPSSFRIKQYKDIQLNKGVFAGKFQISKEPALGKWSIVVTISGKYDLVKQINFDVEKYVLPKFSVIIETEPFIVKKDRFITIDVYGKYTYGKYVEGYVELEIFRKYFYFNDILLKRNGDIVDFKAKFEIDVISTEMLSNNYKALTVRANLVEKHTNLTESTEVIIQPKHQSFSITIYHNEIELYDNQPFTINAIVEYWNGTKVNDPSTQVILQCDEKKYLSNLDENAVASFIFDKYPAEECIAKYKDSSKMLLRNNRANFIADNKQQSKCSLKLKDKRPHLGAVIEIVLTSDANISYFVYTLTGHGNIIHFEHVKLDSPQKSYTIEITPTIKMVPNSFLYVHYIQNGNLNYCELDIKLPREFQNKISITAPSNVKPGQEVIINIETEPNSYVSILAIDLKVNLLDSHTSLKKNVIMDDMEFRKSFANAGAIIMPGLNSGLVTLTDANFVFKHYVSSYEENNYSGELMLVEKEETNRPSDTLFNLRSKFPETWIFEDLEISQKSTALALNIPDTITTWLISAFSINEITGFGMLDESFEITVFQPFFISTHLPYSIKRGEIINIPLTIFNYFPKDLQTEIVMENIERDYRFVDGENNVIPQVNLTKSINVPANTGKSIDFRICPLKVGDIDIRIIAQNPLTSDGVQQKLKVEPEGIVKQYNRDVFLSLRNSQTYTSSFTAEIPKDIVADSQYLLLSIGGDVLVPSLENLEDLVLMPTGCGEQNMINLVPNILVLDYLKAIRKTSKYPTLVAKAKQYIENGYQQQLQFRHDNGGYSVFGPKWSSSVSNWLTAYVIRFFIKGLKYSDIETRIIENGLEYLKNQQLSNGEFPHTGYLFYPAHQNRYGFTAFVLLTFLETKKYSKKYNQVIQKGIDFLVSNANDVNDTYALAIMATALQMSKNEYATKILTKLQTVAKEENNLKWWTGSSEKNSNDVEITSYILMALLETPGEHLPISEWLLQQRNQHGGFKSTHNTVVGLQALIKFATNSSPVNNTQLKILYTAKNEQGYNLKYGIIGIDPDNMLVLQQHELPPSTRTLYYELSGHGNVFMQFSYNYYVSTSAEIINVRFDDVQADSFIETNKFMKLQQKTFIITPTAKLNNPITLDLEICFEYQPAGDGENQLTNMVIIELNLPTGFISNLDNLKELKSQDLISRTETKNYKTKIIIYLAKLKAKTQDCLDIVADKINDVSNLKPSAIVMYDYYSPEQRDVVSYEIHL